MRIKIEDLPKGVEIRGFVIDIDVNLVQNTVSSPSVKVIASESQPDISKREPKPIPDEMNQSF